MNTNSTKRYFWAFAANIIIAAIIGITSYYCIENLKTVLIKTIIGGCTITIIWTWAIYPINTTKFVFVGWGIFLQRSILNILLFIMMSILCLGICLSGKKLQRQHHPESFIML